MSRTKATLVGLISVALWSANVGLIRTVSQALGAFGGAAMLYSVSTVLLFLTFGFPRLSTFPRKYLYIASVLFVIVEVCFSVSLGLAHNGRQTLELGMVNYLWPAMTILMAVLINGQKANLLLIPGLALALMGISLVLGGEAGFSPTEMLQNVMVNPLAYGMAFFGAFTWSIYCSLTARMAQGKNGVTFFFMLTALVLWAKILVGGGNPIPHLTLASGGYVLLASAALGLGYGAWNLGILHGNVTVLAAASYFIPVFSSMLTAFLVDTPLTAMFWKGCLLTCAGSFLCWLSTREKTPRDRKRPTAQSGRGGVAP